MTYYIIDNHSCEGPIMQPQVYTNLARARADLQALKEWCDVADFRLEITDTLPNERYIDLTGAE